MSAQPAALSPRIDLVYTKTLAGRHEVAARGAGLSARQRAALIMLDGQRDAGMLAAIMPADQVAAVLATLLALELIDTAAPAQAETVPAPAPAPAADPARLSAIKAELVAAAETYLGAMGVAVVARVHLATDDAQLLRVLGHWHMAMQDSKHGKEAATILLEKTRSVLQGAALA